MKVVLSIIVLLISICPDKIQIGKTTGNTGDLNQLTYPISPVHPIELIRTDDSLKSFKPDFFEIDSLQFEKFKSGRFANWFVTKDAKSRLYFVPYTDYSITTAVLTASNKLPKDIMELLDFEGIKYNDVKNAIQARDIHSRRGFRLGVTKQFAINVYGAPKSKNKKGDLETMTWNFQMKEGTKYKGDFLTPYIMNGLAYDVELTFKNDRLYMLIYRYGVP